MQRHLPSEGSGGMGGGGREKSLSGVLFRKLWAWGAAHIPLPISQTRLFPKKEKKKKHSLKTCCQRKGTLVEEEVESLGPDCGGGG